MPKLHALLRIASLKVVDDFLLQLLSDQTNYRIEKNLRGMYIKEKHKKTNTFKALANTSLINYYMNTYL